jgi:DNA-binding transcriptional MocR family regulator
MDADRHMSGHTLARHLGSWRGGRAAYAELAERITLLVRDGRLPINTRLPAERELASALGLSRTTVASAYELLRQTGFLHSRRGAGSWTALPEQPIDVQLPPFAPAGEDADLDLAHASPSAPPELAGALRVAAERLGRHTGGSGYHLLGLPTLRAAVAARFTARGLPTGAEQILITCGAQQAIALVLAAMAMPGDRVLVEHPTYPNALGAIAAAHARAVPVGFAGDDWDLDTFAGAIRDASPRLVYLIPDFHNPTGRCMDPATRTAFIELCRRTGTTLLIDETMSDLALDADPPLPLAALAGVTATTPLVTVGSASKTFWGGLRIGWVRARRPVIEQLARVRAGMDMSSPVLEQLITEELLGDPEPIVARRRGELRAARDRLRELLARRLPTWRAPSPAGGLTLWADLGAPVSSALVAAAHRRGVLLAAGPRFGVDGAFERCLRLPYTLPEAKLTRAVERLAEAWESVPWLQAEIGARPQPDVVA